MTLIPFRLDNQASVFTSQLLSALIYLYSLCSMESRVTRTSVPCSCLLNDITPPAISPKSTEQFASRTRLTLCERHINVSHAMRISVLARLACRQFFSLDNVVILVFISGKTLTLSGVTINGLMPMHTC
jgi:hypothetical protein